jgi:hypothetical protein
MFVTVPVFASVWLTALKVGTTVVGTFTVNSAVFSPTTAVPFLVTHLMVTVPFIALGILFARLMGTVQVVDVATPLWIVTYEPPAKAYERSWVKLVLALGVLIVTAVPMSTLVALSVGVVALGMVFSVPVPLPLLVPTHAPAKVISKV